MMLIKPFKKKTNYKFSLDYLKDVRSSEKDSFFEEFKSIKESYINIPFEDTFYNLSDIKNENKFDVISFFSGAGGLDLGAKMAGGNIVYASDFEDDCIKTLKSNKIFSKTVLENIDIRNFKVKSVSALLKKSKKKLIIIGGPPCQPFSKAGYWVTNEKRLASKDPRNMVDQYLDVVEQILPDGFLLENVESILHPKNLQQMDDIKNKIIKMNYSYKVVSVNSEDYGVPQRRKRVFILASKKNFTDFISPTHGAEKDLLPIESTINWIGVFDKKNFFEKEEVPNPTYFKDLCEVPPGKNYLNLTSRDNYPNPKFEANKRFWSFLLKLHPLKSSWTIAAQPGPWVGPLHWSNRRLRIPEISAIQTFPRDFNFYGSRRSIQKQIGNAVPPILAQKLIKFLVDHI